MKDIVIAAAMRTAIGSYGGSLKSLSPTELGVATARSALEKAGVDASDVHQTYYGNVIHTEPKDMYLARTIGMGAGVPETASALTVNRLCGSGLQAIVSGTQSLAMGDAEVVLAGGSESMSRAGYLLPSVRWGQRLGDTSAIDMMTAVLHDPFGHGHMGITAENISKKYGISRQQQDEFSAESHRRAQAATEAGYFNEQIVPMSIRRRNGDVTFKTDEHIRQDARLEDFGKLRPAFDKEGTVTAGNASGLNDGAASLVLMTSDAAERKGVRPLARILSYGIAGVDPRYMGIGPVPAMKSALDKAGLSIEQLDVIESNEAFAAQACAVTSELGLPSTKVNPNGGAVALGHPLGASGAIIATKLVHELVRSNGRFGAATMCVGGGQGIALIVENTTG